MVGRPNLRFGGCRESLQEVLEGREVLPKVQKALLEVRKRSGDPSDIRGGVGIPSKGPRVVRRPSRRSGRGQEILQEVQEGLGGPPRGAGGPPEGSGEVGRPFQNFGRGREALPEVWEGSGGPPKGLGWLGRP